MRTVAQILEEVRAHGGHGALEIREAHERGIPVVGTYCGYMPWEIVTAAGAIPVGLCARSADPIPAAEEHLPRNLCPLIKASYGHALRGSCPYFYFCDLVVAETTCDGKKKMYELLGELKPLHLVQIPQRPDRPEDRALLREEFLKVRERMEDLTGRRIREEDLASAIAQRNRERKALMNLWELSRRENPPLTGLEMQQITEDMQYRFHKESAIPWLEGITAELAQAPTERDLTGRPRLLVTGCPIGGVLDKLELLESAGGLVVCYENCGGQKDAGMEVSEEGDGLDALAEKYLAIGCSVMSPNPRRMESLERLIRHYRIDGVVEIVLTACHTYAVESTTVRRLAHSMGKGYLALETDYSSGDLEQWSTRVGAFLEML